MNPPPTPSTGDVWREVIDGPGRVLPADLRAAMEAREAEARNPTCHCGVPLRQHRWEEHSFVPALERGPNMAAEMALDLVAYLHAGDAPVLLRWGALALLWAVWRWG